MRLSRRTFVAAAAAAALAPKPGAAQEPRRGGTLRVASDSEYRNWNPAIAANNGVFLVARKIVEPLFDLGADGRTLVPLLATAWTPSADGKTHSFALRPGVKWHDGREFTSADVAFSALQMWKALQNFGREVFRNLEAVDTPNPQTAVFRFAQPIPSQLVAAALPALSNVVPKHVFEGTDIPNNPANINLVGTGPFRYGEYRRGEFFSLTRNPDYWASGQPRLDGITFRVMPDKGAVAAALEAGQLDLACFGGVSLEDMERLGRLPALEAVSRGYEALLYTSILEFNYARPEFQNLKVRQAIAHALDPAAAVQTIFGGHAKPSVGPIPTTDPVFHTSDVARYPYDRARAEALLDEAGYPRAAGGMRFAVRIVPAPFFEQTRRIGDLMRQSLRTIGIDASIVNTDLAGFFTGVYRDRNFDMTSSVYVHRQDPAISTTVLYSTGTPAGVPFSNQRGYANPEMDTIIRSAASEVDPARRVELYKRFQQLAMTDLPLIPFVEYALASVASRKLREHHDDPRWPVTGWGKTWLRALIRRRLAQAIPILLIVLIGNFLLLQMAPGDAVDAYVAGLGGGADAGQIAELRARWGLDRPLLEQLGVFLWRMVRLDLGYSFIYNQPVGLVILDRLPTTMLLMLCGIAFAFSCGVLLGIAAARHAGTWRDTGLVTLALIAYAIPGFWLGLMMIVVFSVQLGWLPLGGLGTLGGSASGLAAAVDIARHLLMPTIAVSLIYLAIYLRLMRASMLEVYSVDFVRTARAKGLSERAVAWRHVARNALLPVITMLGVHFSALFGGSVVVESVFSLPGIGRLAYDSVVARDLNTLLGIIFVSAVVVILVNLVVDLAYARLDPRIAR